MELGYIYKLELNIDLESFKKGECYIGKHNGAKPDYFGSGRIVKRLYKKFGKQIFTREILAKCIKEDDFLCYLEVYYINHFKSNRCKNGSGLNLTDGGEGSYGNKRSEEYCKLLSERVKKSYKENGRKTPTEKFVYQYSRQDGSFIKKFDNCVLAAREVGVLPSTIACCARGETRVSKGFFWSYAIHENFIPPEIKMREVYQYDVNMNLIKKWDSIKQINKELGYSKSFICNCCNNRAKTSHGFIWKYKKDII